MLTIHLRPLMRNTIPSDKHGMLYAVRCWKKPPGIRHSQWLLFVADYFSKLVVRRPCDMHSLKLRCRKQHMNVKILLDTRHVRPSATKADIWPTSRLNSESCEQRKCLPLCGALGSERALCASWNAAMGKHQQRRYSPPAAVTLRNAGLRAACTRPSSGNWCTKAP